MGLRILTRKIKIELISEHQDICQLIFTQARAQHACRLFLEHLKTKRGLTREEMSKFAWDLEAGQIEKGFKYSRRSFYTQIRRTLYTLGLIGISQRLVPAQDWEVTYEKVKEKYVPIRQPIPKRPPDGVNLPRLTWIICKAWNDEFLPKKENQE
jgi:hypothetical protein